jgi:outer membrane cobalamin receptor
VLEPFETWTDAYNVQAGNSSLKPEYIDSYEIGYQTHLGPSLISAEAYYRQTHNRIEWVRSVYDHNITLHSIENIGKDYALGSELSLNFDLSKKWNVNLMGNLYNYRIAGALFGESFSRESLNWKTRISNTVKLGASARIQLDGIYKSPFVSTQVRREGYFTANVAIKCEFPGKLLSATLQINDLLRSAKNEHISEGVFPYIQLLHQGSASGDAQSQIQFQQL